MTAEKLKELRESSLMTQREFAAAMGVPLRTYENLESGRTDVRQIHINAARWAIVESKAHDKIGNITAPEEISIIIEDAASNL